MANNKNYYRENNENYYRENNEKRTSLIKRTCAPIIMILKKQISQCLDAEGCVSLPLSGTVVCTLAFPVTLNGNCVRPCEV